MHTICYIILLIAYALGSAAYAGLVWCAFVEPSATEREVAVGPQPQATPEAPVLIVLPAK